MVSSKRCPRSLFAGKGTVCSFPLKPGGTNGFFGKGHTVFTVKGSAYYLPEKPFESLAVMQSRIEI